MEEFKKVSLRENGLDFLENLKFENPDSTIIMRLDKHDNVIGYFSVNEKGHHTFEPKTSEDSMVIVFNGIRPSIERRIGNLIRKQEAIAADAEEIIKFYNMEDQLREDDTYSHVLEMIKAALGR